MADSNKFETFISPEGTLVVFERELNIARDFKGNGDFKYKCKLQLEGEAAIEFEQFIENKAKEFAQNPEFSKMRIKMIPLGDVVKPVLDKDKEIVEGQTQFSFGVAATTQTKNGTWDRKPGFYQADGSPYEVEPMIGTGTRASIAFQFYPWKTGKGLSLQPVGIRIVRLVEYGARGSSGSGAKVNPFAADKPAANPFTAAKAAPADRKPDAATTDTNAADF